MNPCRTSVWTDCDEWDDMNTSLLHTGPLFEPILKIRFGHDEQPGSHLVMLHPAKLRTRDFVLTGLVRGEVYRDHQARNRVLLDAQHRHEEAVSYILRPQHHTNGAVDRHCDNVLRRNVIAGRRILTVESQVIGIRIINQMW